MLHITSLFELADLDSELGAPLGHSTDHSTGSWSNLGAPSCSTCLSTGFLERLCSLEVARERLREAIWDDLGLILGRPNLENHRFSLGKTMIFRKSTFSLSEATWRRLGDHLGRLGAPLGPLGHPSWHSEASLGRLGAPPGRLRSVLGWLPGALETLLGPSSGSRPLPGSILGGFWVDLGVDLCRFGDRTR